MGETGLVSNALHDTISPPTSKNTSRADAILKGQIQFRKPALAGLQAGKRPQPMSIRNEATGVDRLRRVLYRNFHDIAKVVYLVEISKND